MIERIVPLAFTVLLAGALAACGAESDGDNNAPVVEKTKAQMIQDLRAMADDVKADKIDAVLARIAIPEGAPMDKFAKGVTRSLKQELSESGIDVLQAKGKYGLASELFGDRAAGWAKRANVPVAECYGVSLDNAQVMAHWNGSAFRYVRVNNVAKLK